MKKLLAISLLALSFVASAGNNFNTLDAAPSVTVGSALPTGTNSIGQVTANAGTNLNTSALALDASVTATTGSKAAGTAAASAILTGGVYNSTLPAPTTGQQTALQVDATGRLRVNASEVASGAADSGNPLKMGCVYNSTLPTFTTGQRGDCQLGTRGSISVQLMAPDVSTALGVQAISADGLSASTVVSRLQMASYGYSLNASTLFDRNRSGIIAPSATLTGFQNALPWAIYNATPTVRTEAQGGPLQTDVNGALNVATHAVTQSGTWTIAPGAAATGGYSFSNLKANATTTVKSGAGTLHTISINTKGLTNTVTVYDNTAGSGTTIATLDTTLGQDTLTFDLAFSTGLTIVIAGGTAADITITYK